MTTFSMAIERRVSGRGAVCGEIVPHPFHLGTNLLIALQFVFEELRKPATMSVCLIAPNGEKQFFDSRDLPENCDSVVPVIAPRHEHDCDSCTFLGYVGQEDVYSHGETLIRRFGSEGPDYSSFPIGIARQIPDYARAVALFDARHNARPLTLFEALQQA